MDPVKGINVIQLYRIKEPEDARLKMTSMKDKVTTYLASPQKGKIRISLYVNGPTNVIVSFKQIMKMDIPDWFQRQMELELTIPRENYVFDFIVKDSVNVDALMYIQEAKRDLIYLESDQATWAKFVLVTDEIWKAYATTRDHKTTTLLPLSIPLLESALQSSDSKDFVEPPDVRFRPKMRYEDMYGAPDPQKYLATPYDDLPPAADEIDDLESAIIDIYGIHGSKTSQTSSQVSQWIETASKNLSSAARTTALLEANATLPIDTLKFMLLSDQSLVAFENLMRTSPLTLNPNVSENLKMELRQVADVLSKSYLAVNLRAESNILGIDFLEKVFHPPVLSSYGTAIRTKDELDNYLSSHSLPTSFIVPETLIEHLPPYVAYDPEAFKGFSPQMRAAIIKRRIPSTSIFLHLQSMKLTPQVTIDAILFALPPWQEALAKKLTKLPYNRFVEDHIGHYWAKVSKWASPHSDSPLMSQAYALVFTDRDTGRQGYMMLNGSSFSKDVLERTFDEMKHMSTPQMFAKLQFLVLMSIEPLGSKCDASMVEFLSKITPTSVVHFDYQPMFMTITQSLDLVNYYRSKYFDENGNLTNRRLPIIVGGRGSGKSSLLKMLRKDLPHLGGPLSTMEMDELFVEKIPDYYDKLRSAIAETLTDTNAEGVAFTLASKSYHPLIMDLASGLRKSEEFQSLNIFACHNGWETVAMPGRTAMNLRRMCSLKFTSLVRALKTLQDWRYEYTIAVLYDQAAIDGNYWTLGLIAHFYGLELDSLVN
jgi:hypothetical protein